MNIILLSGGSGKRLWPLSNDIRSKQFIKIFRGTDGYESMLQRMYRGIRYVDPAAKLTIATSGSQVSTIHNQIGEDVNISVEPCRRDTFPAIALASVYLNEICGVGLDEPVVVCPVDPYVDDEYFKALSELSDLAAKGDANLTLMGIEPTYPSAKYGYIIPASKDKISTVTEFKEKPDEKTAASYIERGALWNGGVFAYKLGYVIAKAHELIDFTDYKDFFEKYDKATKISFDIAVVEKEKSINVMRFSGTWKDLGTWNTLAEAMEENIIGEGVLGGGCENVHIINELDMPVLVMGLKDAVVSASPEGILVSDKHKSSYIKPYVDEFTNPVMFAEKSWGSYRVIDVESDSMTLKVTLNPGHRMNYHSHLRRRESWNIIEGSGRVIIDGVSKNVGPGDSLELNIGQKHTIIADTRIKLIEVQYGRDIDVKDKIKYDFPE
ncbi:MAG: cupin domain-containing protein [Lachnospiraceae bacterium]|nr:cupin domain-containing protein [Lachnospiraceae bacterium]